MSTEVKKEHVSCENCKCGHWTMFDNEYGRYPVVLCYLHKDCGGDEAYQILEDEWVETAKECKEFMNDNKDNNKDKIMNYYEEKLREIINSNSEYYPSKDKDVLAKYFPELKEDKDERIRKTIYGWIYTQPSEFFDNGFSKEEMLAWVEKQKGGDQ